MDQSLSPVHHIPIPARYAGKPQVEVWFYRGVRDGVEQPVRSRSAFCPNHCVSPHQSYLAFTVYCRGFRLGRLCSVSPRP